MSPHNAFILAAGKGERLRPHTDKMPKPLVEVAGRSLIERTLDHLERCAVSDVTINLHYKGEMIEERLKTRTSPAIHFSHEKELLNTGGGIKKALKNFGDDAFYVLSGDGLWNDGPSEAALKKLADHWDPNQMDILMLLQPVSSMTLTKGVGDYYLEADGRAVRSPDRQGAYMFTSIRINSPRIFDKSPEGAFSYLELMDHAQRRGRLFGLVHDGDWHHISTPQDLTAVNDAFADQGERE